jgi:hypothetical protein
MEASVAWMSVDFAGMQQSLFSRARLTRPRAVLISASLALSKGEC